MALDYARFGGGPGPHQAIKDRRPAAGFYRVFKQVASACHSGAEVGCEIMGGL